MIYNSLIKCPTPTQPDVCAFKHIVRILKMTFTVSVQVNLVCLDGKNSTPSATLFLPVEQLKPGKAAEKTARSEGQIW